MANVNCNVKGKCDSHVENNRRRFYLISWAAASSPVSRLQGVVWLEQHNAASSLRGDHVYISHLKHQLLHLHLSYRVVLFSLLCVPDDEQARRGWELALCWCAGAGEWATVRRPKAMLCPDAALPTDTTGNNGVVATTSWKRRVGWVWDAGRAWMRGRKGLVYNG